MYANPGCGASDSPLDLHKYIHVCLHVHDIYSAQNSSWNRAPAVPVCGCKMHVF